MPKIIVTPLSLVEKTIQAERPSHLLSLLGPEYMIPGHKAFESTRHLRVSIHDIATSLPGQTEPRAQHAQSVLNFADTWDRTSPMLIHCWAGISRSTASMFMILCKLNPGASELGILRRMRALAPHIAPNRLLTAHADDILGRQGRMVDALDQVGPSHAADIGFYFHLPVVIETDPKD